MKIFSCFCVKTEVEILNSSTPRSHSADTAETIKSRKKSLVNNNNNNSLHEDINGILSFNNRVKSPNNDDENKLLGTLDKVPNSPEEAVPRRIPPAKKSNKPNEAKLIQKGSEDNIVIESDNSTHNRIYNWLLGRQKKQFNNNNNQNNNNAVINNNNNININNYNKDRNTFSNININHNNASDPSTPSSASERNRLPNQLNSSVKMKKRNLTIKTAAIKENDPKAIHKTNQMPSNASSSQINSNTSDHSDPQAIVSSGDFNHKSSNNHAITNLPTSSAKVLRDSYVENSPNSVTRDPQPKLATMPTFPSNQFDLTNVYNPKLRAKFNQGASPSMSDFRLKSQTKISTEGAMVNNLNNSLPTGNSIDNDNNNNSNNTNDNHSNTKKKQKNPVHERNISLLETGIFEYHDHLVNDPLLQSIKNHKVTNPKISINEGIIPDSSPKMYDSPVDENIRPGSGSDVSALVFQYQLNAVRNQSKLVSRNKSVANPNETQEQSIDNNPNLSTTPKTETITHSERITSPTSNPSTKTTPPDVTSARYLSDDAD